MSVSIEKEDAEKILSPYYETLKKCIMCGWEDYMKNYSKHGHIHEIRTKAGIIRDHIIGHIRDNFSDTPGVKILPSRDGLFLLRIGNRLYLRFKKLDCALRSSSYPTIQTKLFNNQRSLNLPNMPPDPVYLNAGYTPDRAWSRIEGVHIACRIKKEIAWAIDLTNIATSQSAVESLPTSQREEGRSKVRVKKHLIMNQEGIQNAKDGK